MPITPEQAVEIKKQLLKQVEQLPQENKEQIKEHIKKLSPEELEEFLKQNKIAMGGGGGEGGEAGQSGPECVFCSITKGEMPSYKIAENKKAIAILEINPLSKGHSIILPLDHASTEKIPKSAMTLAQQVAKKIKAKLKPEDMKIETSGFQGHSMINIIPLYKDKEIKKEKAEEKDLKELQSQLETKKRGPRPKSPSKPSSKKSNLPEISFRIP